MILKCLNSIYSLSCLRFRINRVPPSDFLVIKMGETYSIDSWHTSLITPFFRSFFTSSSTKFSSSDVNDALKAKCFEGGWDWNSMVSPLTIFSICLSDVSFFHSDRYLEILPPSKPLTLSFRNNSCTLSVWDVISLQPFCCCWIGCCIGWRRTSPSCLWLKKNVFDSCCCKVYASLWTVHQYFSSCFEGLCPSFVGTSHPQITYQLFL